MQSYRAAAFATLLTIAPSGAALAQAMPPMPTNDPAAMANVRESDQQCRGWYRRCVAGHPSVPPSEATRLAPQSAIVKPPLTLSTWPVM